MLSITSQKSRIFKYLSKYLIPNIDKAISFISMYYIISPLYISDLSLHFHRTDRHAYISNRRICLNEKVKIIFILKICSAL